MLKDYKADLTPENEARLPCAWCGAPHVGMWRGYYRCARHERTTGKPPPRKTTPEPTADELAQAVANGLITAHGAVEVARKR